MKKNHRFLTLSFLVCVLVWFPLRAWGQETVPRAKLPVLTTSAGQSTDVNTLNAVMEQAEVKYDYCDVPTTAMIRGGVGLGGAKAKAGFHVEVTTDLTRFKAGTPYQAVIFAIGASLKGMGASGLTVDTEVKRLTEIIQYCKQNKIFIIAVHPGGQSRRGAPGSDNERMIDAVAPFADYIIVAKDGNKDGRFTKIAKDKGIPISQVDYALGMVGLIKKVFE
jgi:hypothetical protein